jgi:hypothetical protein
MAQAVNRVEFPFTTNVAGIALTTRYDFSAITLYIPETTGSRVFRSARVEVTVRDNAAAETSMTKWLIGIKLGAVAFDDVEITSTITGSGEHDSYVFSRDVTAYFATNFGSGASQTAQVGVRFTTTATTNVTAKLVITYEYDTTSTTYVKTVKIPLDTTLGSQATSATEIGTNQIPALDTELGESSKVYRDIWIEIDGNEQSTAATAFQLGITIDSGSEELDGSHNQTLNSSVWYKYISRQTSLTTNAVHAFKLRTTPVANMTHPAIVLCVTYEYDPASTTIYNSIQIPLGLDQGALGWTTSANATRFLRKLFIEEPGTITLKQSGIYVGFVTGNISASGPRVIVGSQTERVYTNNSGSVVCGMYALTQRFDSGAIAGAGVTLARGENTITVDAYSSSSTLPPESLHAVLYLNYSSGRATGGPGTHNHTTEWIAYDTPAPFTAKQAAPVRLINIPEASYYVNGLGITYQDIEISANSGGTLTFDWQALSGEGAGNGWKAIGADLMPIFQRNTVTNRAMPCGDLFKRWPTNPNPALLVMETSRVLKTTQLRAQSSFVAVQQLLTYHSITYTVSGTLNSWTGDGSGITVNIFRADTFEWIGQVTTAAGGTYTFTWYDNTINVFSDAFQDGTHLGRSVNGTAV